MTLNKHVCKQFKSFRSIILSGDSSKISHSPITTHTHTYMVTKKNHSSNRSQHHKLGLNVHQQHSLSITKKIWRKIEQSRDCIFFSYSSNLVTIVKVFLVDTPPPCYRIRFFFFCEVVIILFRACVVFSATNQVKSEQKINLHSRPQLARRYFG